MPYPFSELLALANDTRATLLERLEKGPLTVGELTKGLPVSQPAVSQDLRVLEQAQLVTEEYQGTRHIYRLNPDGLRVLRAWLDRFWTISLDAFAAEVERGNAQNTAPHATSRRPARS